MAKKKAHGVVVRANSGAAQTKAAVAESSAAPEQAESSKVPEVRRKGKKRKRAAVAGTAPAAEGDSENDEEKEPDASKTRPASPWSANVSKADLRAGLEWLVWPMSPDVFLAEYWEKKPLHLKRKLPNYYAGLFTKEVLDKKLRDGSEVKYGERINIVRFDEKRVEKLDLNVGPRGTVAKAKDVDEAWASGASIQALHPQQFHLPVRATLASLERSFGALFGANSYMTPTSKQGLAPHFDDVEVFMLQLEGSKRWHLHEPPPGEEYPLPRDYSRDFVAGELGPQLLDCLLEQGDLLYLPRGTVHSGVTDANASFSHHLTVSTYQRVSWTSLLEKALAGALEKAAAESSEFREGLPLNFLQCMGSWHDVGGPDSEPSRSQSGPRAAFCRRFQGLFSRLHEFVDLDEVCDELGVDFMAHRLPPAPSVPASSSTAGSKEQGETAGVTLDSMVRWVDHAAMRPMVSTDPDTSEATVLLFHSCSNQCEQHMCVNVEAEEDVGCLRFEAATFLPALRLLCAAGTTSVRCGDLPITEESDRVALCENLLESGCLELVQETSKASGASDS